MDPTDNKTYRLTKIQQGENIYFVFDSDFNKDRNMFMQSFMLIPGE